MVALLNANAPATAMRDRRADALLKWRLFLSNSLLKRLGPDKFDALVGLQQSRSPLSPILIADLLLRPEPHNHYAPDPLVPAYLDVLVHRRLVTPAAVLFALARYSTSRAEPSQNGEGSTKPEGALKPSEKRTIRWANSYTIEHVVFLRLANAVKQENAIKSVTDAVAMIRIAIKWMALFSDLSAAFVADVMGAIDRATTKLEMECSRSAFVLLLSQLCEHPTVLAALTGPSAKGNGLSTTLTPFSLEPGSRADALLKGGRKQLSDGLAKFLATLQPAEIPAQLEIFRAQTLPALEPVDKRKEAEEAEEAQVYEVFDQTVGLENFQVRELPINNTRAGLYIYLNAAVSPNCLFPESCRCHTLTCNSLLAGRS